MLVKDKTTQNAYVHMTVKSGSTNDPPNFFGCSHLLEHLLLSSVPCECDKPFTSFILKEGGNYSGSTEYSLTNFSYNVSRSALKESLNQFEIE